MNIKLSCRLAAYEASSSARSLPGIQTWLGTQQSYLFSSKFQIVQFVNYFACYRGEGSVPVLDRVEITPIESRKITKSRPDICSIAEKARETA